jgi:C4-dicarboxylate transporter/malic acid transport protein
VSTGVDERPATRTSWPRGRGVTASVGDHPGACDAFANITPNWFAAVMGTGIVATAAASLPHRTPGLHTFATGVWLLAAVLLGILILATVTHWALHPVRARSHLTHPTMGHFYGAPPMAMLTVGAGSLLLGGGVIGRTAAVRLDWVLWILGTATGLATAALVPYLLFTRGAARRSSPFGGWLMPVVPPMVSATTGALLVPTAHGAQTREALLALCYSMFGLSLIASLIVIGLIWGQLGRAGVGPAGLVPTLWIVLGPLGQSVTAANGMGNAAQDVLPAPYDAGAADLALFFGLATWGFAMLWLAVAVVITVRTARRGLPFSLTWWSFTFPVGTVVTATSALAARSGLEVLAWSAVALYVGLLAAWGLVFSRTVHGVIAGRLLVPA